MASTITLERPFIPVIPIVEQEPKPDAVSSLPSISLEISAYQKHLKRLASAAQIFRAATHAPNLELKALKEFNPLPQEIQNQVFEALWIARKRL